MPINNNKTTLQGLVSHDYKFNTNRQSVQIALFDGETGAAVDLGAAPSGADVELAGYEIGGVGAVAETDSVNDAIAKLEARIVALENA